MKLALGTVQFGMPYGIANQTGQVSRDEVGKILAYAQEIGIDTLDTAIGYGKSEACIGEIGVKRFKVVTKLPAVPKGIHDVEAWIDAQIKISLQRLQADSVYGLLLHRSENLTGSIGKIVKQKLEHLKSRGIVRKIGVSIYYPKELDEIARLCSIDLVQIPLNCFDQRLAASGWLDRLLAQGVEIHARSVFMQGLLLMPKDKIPLKFSRWHEHFDRWYSWLRENNVTSLEACLGVQNSFPQVSRFVVGVDSLLHLKEIAGAISRVKLKVPPEFYCEDEMLIIPTNWNLL